MIYASFLRIVVGRRNADPIVLTHRVSALSRANQRWGSRCHGKRFYFSLSCSQRFKLICILRHCSKSLPRRRSAALYEGFLEAKKLSL